MKFQFLILFYIWCCNTFFRCIDHLDGVLSLNNSKFGNYVKRISPIELVIQDTTETDKSASYFDLNLEIDTEGRLKTKLYDKRDDVSYPIVNFPFLCSKNPAVPAYGVYMYISQIIRCSRDCISYHDFLDKVFAHKEASNQLFQTVKLKSSLQKFYRRHHELVDRYGITVS